jgi:hypothetical protein
MTAILITFVTWWLLQHCISGVFLGDPAIYKESQSKLL